VRLKIFLDWCKFVFALDIFLDHFLRLCFLLSFLILFSIFLWISAALKEGAVKHTVSSKKKGKKNSV